MTKRQATIKRNTAETKISLRLNIDGKGKSKIDTGIGFFDHMLTLFAKHAVVDLTLKCKGDLEVDGHHTVEDCGIALGDAFVEALGDKKGIRRYGSGFHPKNPFTGEAYLPMDETLTRCVIDFSGRPYLVWRKLGNLSHKKISDEEKQQDMSSAFRFGLAREFFQGFTNAARSLRGGTPPCGGRSLQGLGQSDGFCLSGRSTNRRANPEYEGKTLISGRQL